MTSGSSIVASTRIRFPELIEKLCVLVPAPRTHLLRYHGVLAPHAAWRRKAD